MGLFSSSKKELLIAALDIGNSSVAGILFKHQSKKTPAIITSIRFPIGSSSDSESANRRIDMDKSLHAVLEKTLVYLKKTATHKKRVDLFVIVLSSPYFISQTKIIRLKKQKAFDVNDRLLNEIINGEAELFKKQWRKEHNGEIDFIEREKMKIKLNGYSIRQPLGKRVKNLETCVYMSVGAKNFQDKIKKCVFYHFGERPFRFQTYPFIAFSALKNIISISQKDALLIDVRGEITDLVMIKKGTLEEVISFSMGENVLIKKIANAFNFSFDEASHFLAQYVRGDLHADVKVGAKKIIGNTAAEWHQLLEKSLKGLSDNSFIPAQAFFIGAKPSLLMKESFICEKDCEKDFLFQGRFLTPEAFKSYFSFERGFAENKDVPLMLAALFANQNVETIINNK